MQQGGPGLQETPGQGRVARMGRAAGWTRVPWATDTTETEIEKTTRSRGDHQVEATMRSGPFQNSREKRGAQVGWGL